jgi:SAM-dependent methyltransferase
MREIFHWPRSDRLVYFHESATPAFWDGYWEAQGKPPTISHRDYVVAVTKKYLDRGARILEGGCGRANKVKALADAGFSPIGIDFAEKSVQQARRYYPGLDIRMGDVRSLDFSNDSFDGYWSIGVIEHFWTGYDSILAEAARVLRPQGFIFLTAPWFSPYRQRKARSGGYATVDFEDEPELFYQFALGRKEVSTQLKRHGFKLIHWRGLGSETSMKQDMSTLRRQIDWIFASRGSIVKRVLRRAITAGLDPYCGHSFLAVAQLKITNPDS